MLLEVVSRLLKANPAAGACRTRPLARPLPPGTRKPGVDEEMRWDPRPCIIRLKGRGLTPPSKMGYLSGQNPLDGTAHGHLALPPNGAAPLWGHVT